jgi:spore coat protein CotH
VAIRSAGIRYDASMLQEPLTNSIFELLGQPITETAYVGLRLNDDAEQLYTIAEVIEEDYLARHFANADGVLYKAEFNATMSYLGEDPSAYARSFTQETRLNDADMGPLIDFLQFVSETDDATFESELPNVLDVDSFAIYLAINNLLVNPDSMAGMGNNFYLYYDDSTGRMSVLMWDANESLGKLSGGVAQGGRQALTQNSSASFDIYYSNVSNFGRAGRGGTGATPSLVSRFLANPTYRALYEEKLIDVYQKAFLSGALISQVEQFSAVVRAANAERNFVDTQAYDQAVSDVLDFIGQRNAYLAGTNLLGQVTLITP